METLLSTVAQISFTIVGLFFVVLTVDSDTRNRWFGQPAENQYVRINLLVMLMPAFLSLGTLINVSNDGFPSWIITAVILGVISILIASQLRKMKKTADFQRFASLETRLNVSNIALSNAFVLLLLALFGFASFYVRDIAHLIEQTQALKTLIVISLVDSVLPVINFSREFLTPKPATTVSSTLLMRVDADRQVYNSKKETEKSTGVFCISVLVASFVAFLIGLFFNRD